MKFDNLVIPYLDEAGRGLFSTGTSQLRFLEIIILRIYYKSDFYMDLVEKQTSVLSGLTTAYVSIGGVIICLLCC